MLALKAGPAALCGASPRQARLLAPARSSSPSLLRRPPAPPAAAAARRHPRRLLARASSSTTGGSVQKVTGEELEKLLADGDVRKVPVIIDLFATWCGPCLLLAEELEKVAKELGPEGVRIFKVDVDAEQELASQLQVQALPTIIMIGKDPAKPALRAEGLLTAKKIVEIVKTELQ
jgi:thioredoxin-like negative regulator of GroEL